MKSRLCLGQLSVAIFVLVFMGAQTGWANDNACPYEKLKWADFEGAVPADPGHDALTWGGMNTTWTGSQSRARGDDFVTSLMGITTSATFDNNKSWVKAGFETDALLEHEQYHMDLWAICACKLKQALGKIEGVGATAAAASTDALTQGTAVAAKHLEDCKAEQAQYDVETAHGTKAAE